MLGNNAYKKYFSSLSSDIISAAEKDSMPNEPSASDSELQPSSRSNTPPVDDEIEYIPWEPDIQEMDYEFDTEIDMSKRKTVKKPSEKKKESRPTKKGERSYMTADDINELKFLFKDYLQERRSPTKLVIKEILEKSKGSGGHIHRFTVEKIQKRLCNMVSTYTRKTRLQDDE